MLNKSNLNFCIPSFKVLLIEDGPDLKPSKSETNSLLIYNFPLLSLVPLNLYSPSNGTSKSHSKVNHFPAKSDPLTLDFGLGEIAYEF